MWRRYPTRRVLIGAVAGLIAACSDTPPPVIQPEPLPSLTVMRLDGSPVTHFPPTGKFTVMNIWATWCPPCRRELPSLQQLANLLDSERFAVEGVALDEDLRLVREYLIDQNVTFAGYVASDPDALSSSWGIKNVPATLLIDEQGRVVERVVGERLWHTQEQVERLRRLAQH